MSDEADFLHYLPKDVSTHILLMLPVRSLLTCTCVCKTWNSFIKSPEFFSSHLDRSISLYEKNDNHLCLFQLCSLPVKTGRDSFFLRSKNPEFNVRERLQFPYRCTYGFQVITSCNGLVCLMEGKYNVYSSPWNLILWNPFLRKSMILKHQNLNFLEAAGLGFDSRTGDYKLLTIIEEPGNETTLMVNLYSLKENSWKRLPDVEAIFDRSTDANRAMAFLNGALYFVASRGQYQKPCFVIFEFDLSNEVFHEIMLPDCMVNEADYGWFRKRDCCLFTCEKSLAVLWLMDDLGGRGMEIWVMKEHAVEGSWTQISRVWLEGLGDERDLAITGITFREDANVLLSLGSYGNDVGLVYSHDIKSKVTKEIEIDRRHSCIFLGDYVESLVLLDKGDDLSRLFVTESVEACDTSGNKSLVSANSMMGTSSHETSSSNAANYIHEHDVSWSEGSSDLEEDSDVSDDSIGNQSEDSSSDLASNSSSHASDELSGYGSDTSNGLST